MVVVVVDWAGEELVVDWAGVLEDGAGAMVNRGGEASAGALLVWVGMTVARADDRPPLVTGPRRVSEVTLCSASLHCIVKSKSSHQLENTSSGNECG